VQFGISVQLPVLLRGTYDIFAAYRLAHLHFALRGKCVFDALILHRWSVAKGLTGDSLYGAQAIKAQSLSLFSQRTSEARENKSVRTVNLTRPTSRGR
jgi:hypothetical protein